MSGWQKDVAPQKAVSERYDGFKTNGILRLRVRIFYANGRN